jgi:hypothetical protein
VIDEHASARGFEAQHGLLARIHQRQRGAAECAGRRMKIDVVSHRIAGGVDQRQLDIIAFVHHHERPGNRAIVGHGVHRRAVVVDYDLLLLDDQLEFLDDRRPIRDLIVRMDEWRRDQIDFLAPERPRGCGLGNGRDSRQRRIGAGDDDGGQSRRTGRAKERTASADSHGIPLFSSRQPPPQYGMPRESLLRCIKQRSHRGSV